jgi:1-deoxy-D-xylulose-5-phosphate synthase
MALRVDDWFPLLDGIDTPENLRALAEWQLEPLAHELRDCLIHTVARSGGHFAASLGATELTVALHYVLNTPFDRIVWDVGHQAYAHKILTGRRDRMHTIRRKDGLSGFPRRCESPYDTFGVAHAGTSISAALGMAIAAAREGEGRRVVAVIGDGAMTAGMAFEALSHAAAMHVDLLVILNDNTMSISPNVGGLCNYLTRLTAGMKRGPGHRRGRDRPAEAIPAAGHPLGPEGYSGEPGRPGLLFEEIGFGYFGPVDGHDLPALVKTLRALVSSKGPRLLHVVTRKGKGYAPAEADPVAYHGVAPFDPELGLSPTPKGPPTYTEVFGDWLCDMADRDPRLLGITPAMREGSGLVRFSERHPDRYFDVGIAEQHSVTLAAGLACEGLKPVLAIYSTFLQRAYDQLIHDVAIQKLPVLFAIDRAGIVGPDGATHAGNFDLTYLRCIPNLVVMTPSDENECRQMLYTGFLQDSPAAVRYPRGRGPGVSVAEQMTALPVGQAQLRRKGKRTAILAFGCMVGPALEAAERVDATVVNMRFVKPLDEFLVLEMAATHDFLVTIEDNVVSGGAGSAVNECLAAYRVQVAVFNMGLPDHFVEHGSREELLADCGLSAEGILRVIDYHYRNLLPSARASVIR